MADLLNKVLLIGRLTADPHSKAFGELNVSEFTLALDRKYNRGHQAGTADFFPCVCFGKKADFCNNYLTKGTLIFVEGCLRSSSYVNKEGKKVSKIEVVVEDTKFMEPKRKTAEAASDNSGWEDISADEVPFI